jgi:hypothetical protein
MAGGFLVVKVREGSNFEERPRMSSQTRAASPVDYRIVNNNGKAA